MTTYPTNLNFIKTNGTEMRGNWAHVGHHVLATAYVMTATGIECVDKLFDSKNAILNRSQAIRWILQTAAD